jgi:acetyl-CoA carboxylase biotin carboxyl carrier protein
MTSSNGRFRVPDINPGGGPVILEDLLDAICQRAVTADGPPMSRVRVQAGDVTVEVEWAPQAAAADPDTVVTPAAEPPEDRQAIRIVAPMVGTFYRAPEPGAVPFVEAGDTVTVGQQVGILEAMKLMNAITADQGGVVTAILVGDGEPVEYGQPLVRLDPGGAGEVQPGSAERPGRPDPGTPAR